MKAKISEIFKSIHGEGIYQGKEQVFVRFYGCGLNCSFCDTKLEFYQEKTVEEVLESISKYNNYHSISLTGGEPLLQIDFLIDLCHELKIRHETIYLETNGILHNNLRKIIDYIDIVAMDFKLPSSTRQAEYWSEHKEFLKTAIKKDVFIKAVIGEDTTTEDVTKAIKLIKEVRHDLCLVLQPQNPLEDLLEEKLQLLHKLCINEHINAQVFPQMHKKLCIP